MSETVSHFYEMDFDVTERKLHIVLDPLAEADGRIESADGTSAITFAIADDGLPYVVTVEVTDPIKISVFQDWIDEWIEKAVSELNATRYDRFEDNVWKGFRGGTDQGHLSCITPRSEALTVPKEETK